MRCQRINPVVFEAQPRLIVERMAKRIVSVEWRSFLATWQHCYLSNTLTEHCSKITKPFIYILNGVLCAHSCS